ncbi:hypothetical protein BDV26DRAFT_288605 [Aspergillus bertholletiae]|uniref:Carrier domain-containing protein n=1 Tax=Aspergillus bertholletiae TaxID=1226010 RepID=A0A5N7BKK8_9EURO|nr:hypothetical protein BDV26DRAFT_288605 [Aspergillus bertholletiae]
MHVELEDIESVIVRQAEGIIEQAVVSVRGDPEFFIAHVVFSRDREHLDRDSFLRDLLSKLSLLRYMCPALINVLEETPLNAHFKTDRYAIAQLELLPISKTMDAAQSQLLTDSQKALKEVWDEVLPMELATMINPHPNLTFFETGGNSLLWIKPQDLVRRRFTAVVSLAELSSKYLAAHGRTYRERT